MNITNYPKSQILLGQNSGYGITWRGCLVRASLLAVGFGGYVLLTKKFDLTENGKRFFYALRKYFPRGKDEENGEGRRHHENEVCPVCLGNSKPGVRSSCGHFLCENCLSKYCEIRCTNSPPCPLCRKPLNSVSSIQISDITENLAASQDLRNSNRVNESVNLQSTQDVFHGGSDGDHEPCNPESETPYLLATNLYADKRNFLGRNFIAWSSLLVAAALMLPWCEFIGYGSIFDFLMRLALVVMPTIYIWFMYYRDSCFSI